MKLFLGEFEHSLDERSRLTIPRKIRQEIDDREIVLARGFDVCIFGFDRTRWQEEAEKNLMTSVTDDNGRGLRRYLFSAAQKEEIDKLGRIVLPTSLKEYARIVKNTVIIGAGDHFEIWDKERWNQYAQKLNAYERVS